jgi:hypothetical protein
MLTQSTKWLICLCAAVLLAQGCSSSPVNIAPMPPAKYKVLGRATGTGCGSLGIFDFEYYCIPMGLNGRVERAYQHALDSVPGATGLINVELKENWYWWFIGTLRVTTISGDAIKEVAQ